VSFWAFSTTKNHPDCYKSYESENFALNSFLQIQRVSLMQSQIKILIVEDDVIIAQDLQEILEDWGYEEIFKARNYDKAVAILSTEKNRFGFARHQFGRRPNGR
jgi:PleD family two-component response regulator